MRIEKGVTQVNLARSCAMQNATLSKIEAGIANISYIDIFRISTSLKVPVNKISG